MSEATKGSNQMIDEPKSPYHRRIELTLDEVEKRCIELDCNDLIDTLGIERSRLQHAFKKIAYAGKRGHKDLETDIKQAIWSLQNELEAMEKGR